MRQSAVCAWAGKFVSNRSGCLAVSGKCFKPSRAKMSSTIRTKVLICLKYFIEFIWKQRPGRFLSPARCWPVFHRILTRFSHHFNENTKIGWKLDLIYHGKLCGKGNFSRMSYSKTIKESKTCNFVIFCYIFKFCCFENTNKNSNVFFFFIKKNIVQQMKWC